MTLPVFHYLCLQVFWTVYIYTFDNIVVEGIFGIVQAIYIEQAFIICLILGKQEFWFFVILIFIHLPIKWTWSKKQTIP